MQWEMQIQMYKIQTTTAGISQRTNLEKIRKQETEKNRLETLKISINVHLVWSYSLSINTNIATLVQQEDRSNLWLCQLFGTRRMLSQPTLLHQLWFPKIP